MRIAYIAHPVGGDVENNIQRIIKICREINLAEPDVVPFAPYLSDLMALDDSIPAHRERGIKNGIHLLKSGFINELRLYGNTISNGMMFEIEIADRFNVPVVAMTPETDKLRKNKLI